jgi:hypothetical protein
MLNGNREYLFRRMLLVQSMHYGLGLRHAELKNRGLSSGSSLVKPLVS